MTMDCMYTAKAKPTLDLSLNLHVVLTLLYLV